MTPGVFSSIHRAFEKAPTLFDSSPGARLMEPEAKKARPNRLYIYIWLWINTY